MERNRAAKAILAADAIGCLAVFGVALSGRAWHALQLPHVARPFVVTALAATSASLSYGALHPHPSRRTLTFAALTNAGWVGASAFSMLTLRTPTGRAVAGAVMVSDAFAGMTQWLLRPKGDAMR